jgi:hypothetical protein
MSSETMCQQLLAIIEKAKNTDEAMHGAVLKSTMGIDFIIEHRELAYSVDRDEYFRLRRDYILRHKDSSFPWNASEGDNFYVNLEKNGKIIVNANVPCPADYSYLARYKLAMEDLIWEIKDDNKHCSSSGHCKICLLLQ